MSAKSNFYAANHGQGSNLFHQAFTNTTTIKDNTIAANTTNPHTNKALFFSDILFFFDSNIEGIKTKKTRNGKIDELSLELDVVDFLPNTINCRIRNTTCKIIRAVRI